MSCASVFDHWTSFPQVHLARAELRAAGGSGIGNPDWIRLRLAVATSELLPEPSRSNETGRALILDHSTMSDGRGGLTALCDWLHEELGSRHFYCSSRTPPLDREIRGSEVSSRISLPRQILLKKIARQDIQKRRRKHVNCHDCGTDLLYFSSE